MSHHAQLLAAAERLATLEAELAEGLSGPLIERLRAVLVRVTGSADFAQATGWLEVYADDAAQMKAAPTLEAEMARVLNRYSQENSSNTPDWVLADYLLGCLSAFNAAVQAREKWYGRHESALPFRGTLMSKGPGTIPALNYSVWTDLRTDDRELRFYLDRACTVDVEWFATRAGTVSVEHPWQAWLAVADEKIEGSLVSTVEPSLRTVHIHLAMKEGWHTISIKSGCILSNCHIKVTR